MDDLLQCKEIVRSVLEANEASRNSDKVLILKVWAEQRIELKIEAGEITIKGAGFSEMHNPESITRVRREIQNIQGKFLPTLPAVLVNRKIKEEKIRNYYGAGNRILDEWQTIKYGVK